MTIAETTSLRSPARRAVPELRTLPRPVYARRENIPQRQSTSSHSHPWIQLSYASRGVLRIRTGQGLFVAPPQWAILVPPGVEHAVMNTAGTELRSLYIDIAALPGVDGGCEVLGVSPLLREMIRHFSGLPAEYDEDGPHARLVQVMLDLIHDAPRVAFSLPWPTAPALREICTRVLEMPQQPLRLEDWSVSLGISVRTLERAFLQHTGLTLRVWRLRARLLQALPLLERGDSVTDVALACGYESTSSFIASFRRFFGTTPGNFAAGR